MRIRYRMRFNYNLSKRLSKSIASTLYGEIDTCFLSTTIFIGQNFRLCWVLSAYSKKTQLTALTRTYLAITQLRQ